jgi:hypothetical protein
MVLKCLVITGSPAKQYSWGGKYIDGFTGQLVFEVKSEMARLGEVSFEEIRLSDTNLPYCKGCHLWRNFTKNDMASADYIYWHESDLGKHDFAPVIKLGVGKRIFGKMVNGLLGQVTKKWSLLGS